MRHLSRFWGKDATPECSLLPAFAHLAFDQKQFALAVPTGKWVLARDLNNVEALTHVGLILYRAIHVDQALARIDQALRIDPKYAHAHRDRAHILYETKKDLAGAPKSPEPWTGPQPGRSSPLFLLSI